VKLRATVRSLRYGSICTSILLARNVIDPTTLTAATQKIPLIDNPAWTTDL
jgi:hypothetical protein